MSKIRIRNFGPIKEGYQEDDGWFDLKKFLSLLEIKAQVKVQ